MLRVFFLAFHELSDVPRRCKITECSFVCGSCWAGLGLACGASFVTKPFLFRGCGEQGTSESLIYDVSLNQSYFISTPPFMDLLSSRSAAVVLLAVAAIVWKLSTRRKVANAPGIGYGSVPLVGRLRGIYTFMRNPKGTLERGYTKYKNGYFRVSTHTVEYTMVTDQKKLAEYLAQPEDVLSFHDPLNEFLQVQWTLGPGVAERPYHIALIRTKLTQSIAGSVPSLLGEIQDALHLLVGSPVGSFELPPFDLKESTPRLLFL